MAATKRFIIEVEEPNSLLTSAEQLALLAEMEDLCSRKGLSIYDQRIEDDEGWELSA